MHELLGALAALVALSAARSYQSYNMAATDNQQKDVVYPRSITYVRGKEPAKPTRCPNCGKKYLKPVDKCEYCGTR